MGTGTLYSVLVSRFLFVVRYLSPFFLAWEKQGQVQSFLGRMISKDQQYPTEGNYPIPIKLKSVPVPVFPIYFVHIPFALGGPTGRPGSLSERSEAKNGDWYPLFCPGFSISICCQVPVPVFVRKARPRFLKRIQYGRKIFRPYDTDRYTFVETRLNLRGCVASTLRKPRHPLYNA